jgi:diguanylate cyclase (GGDEF)-like protein
MPRLVDHLAELTAFRDRDLLDVTLAGALRDLMRPRGVAIHRAVGDAGAERWLTRARWAEDDKVPTADSAWTELDELPPLDSRPTWADCLRRQEVLSAPASPSGWVTLFPLATDREVVGVLEFATASPITGEQQRTVGSILRIYRNFEGLLDYSERDTLTGLLNRKTFDEAFFKTEPAPAAAHTEAAPSDGRRAGALAARYYLGVIDIDHFKQVNDNHGHLIGDEVLLLLSRLMRASFRYHDRLYRFGGEEFVVLMRCGSGAVTDAEAAFERLRAHTEQYSFPQVGRMTVSVGFTAVRPGDTPNSAFQRADRAVYWAKNHGRNRVACHAALVAEGQIEDDQRSGDVELF